MGESGMTKYVISTVEVTKRVYLVEAYSQSEALDKNIERGPDSAEKVEVLGEMTYSIDAINEYEYNKDWVDLASGRVKREDQKDWVGEIEPVEINEGQGTLLEPATSTEKTLDRLKGPALNEIW